MQRPPDLRPTHTRSPLAATTRNRRLAILRGFCRYLVDKGVLAANPMDGVRRARVPRVTKAAIGVPEMLRLLSVLDREPGSALHGGAGHLDRGGQPEAVGRRACKYRRSSREAPDPDPDL